MMNRHHYTNMTEINMEGKGKQRNKGKNEEQKKEKAGR
jgi:hypothetical protein